MGLLQTYELVLPLIEVPSWWDSATVQAVPALLPVPTHPR
jgi:hypothetical protein